MRERIGIRIRQGFGAHEKSLHPNCFSSSITGANLAMPFPFFKMAINQSSRNRDVITALHHPTFRGQSGYLEWVVTAGQGGLTSSRAQGSVVGCSDVMVRCPTSWRLVSVGCPGHAIVQCLCGLGFTWSLKVIDLGP